MYSLAVYVIYMLFSSSCISLSPSFIFFLLIDKEVVWALAPAFLSAGKSVVHYYATSVGKDRQSNGNHGSSLSFSLKFFVVFLSCME